MAKEVAGLIKLQIKGGAANPSPPVGPALGSKGINIMDFCKQFNFWKQPRLRVVQQNQIVRRLQKLLGIRLELLQKIRCLT